MTPQLGVCFDEFKNINLDYPTSVRILLCFMCIAFAHKSAATIAKSFEPLKKPTHSIYEKIAEYTSNCNRRSRRVYSIPRDSLYMTTIRGILPYTKTTISQINSMGSNPVLTYRNSCECSYWRETYEQYGCNDDDSWEAFCEIAFPDDIPDEWSAEEKAKSHGTGIINPGDPLLWRRWIRRWINMTYMSVDKASSINNDSYLLTSTISELNIEVPMNVWGLGRFFHQLEVIAYEKFAKISSTFNEEDLYCRDLKNDIIMSNMLDRLSIK